MKLLIRKWRIKRGFTLTQLAKKVGRSKSYLSKIERNIEMPHLDVLEDIALVLEVCPRTLIHCNLSTDCTACTYCCYLKQKKQGDTKSP